MVRDIGAMDRDERVALFGEASFLERSVTHIGEAHLREIVEVVFVNRDDIRREAIEIAPVLLEPVCQHGVRELDVVPVEAKPRRAAA